MGSGCSCRILLQARLNKPSADYPPRTEAALDGSASGQSHPPPSALIPDPSPAREAGGGEKGGLCRFMTHPPTLCARCMGGVLAVYGGSAPTVCSVRCRRGEAYLCSNAQSPLRSMRVSFCSARKLQKGPFARLVLHFRIRRSARSLMLWKSCARKSLRNRG
jgi:hypothetical protein